MYCTVVYDGVCSGVTLFKKAHLPQVPFSNSPSVSLATENRFPNKTPNPKGWLGACIEQRRFWPKVWVTLQQPQKVGGKESKNVTRERSDIDINANIALLESVLISPKDFSAQINKGTNKRQKDGTKGGKERRKILKSFWPPPSSSFPWLERENSTVVVVVLQAAGVESTQHCSKRRRGEEKVPPLHATITEPKQERERAIRKEKAERRTLKSALEEEEGANDKWCSRRIQKKLISHIVEGKQSAANGGKSRGFFLFLFLHHRPKLEKRAAHDRSHKPYTAGGPLSSLVFCFKSITKAERSPMIVA